ncbi:MAG: hypothetical protein ACR2FH_06285 [Caulobacteraceae bacterium]
MAGFLDLAAGAAKSQMLHPPTIPPTGAYIGAWVNPNGRKDASAPGSVEIRQLPELVSHIGKTPSILHLFLPGLAWAAKNSGPGGPLQNVMDQMIQRGAAPMPDLPCDVDMQAIADGDPTIRSEFTTLANNLATWPHPIFFRWHWEMNNAPSAKCTHGMDAVIFVPAWRHIWNWFHPSPPDSLAPNVAFVWCPGAGGGMENGNRDDFYPGDRFVDWIGGDAFDRIDETPDFFAKDFQNLYDHYYTDYKAKGRMPKPILVGATGATRRYQFRFISAIQQDLPSRFPGIKAVIYFDAPGNFPGPDTRLSFTHKSFTSFKALVDSDVFYRDPNL